MTHGERPWDWIILSEVMSYLGYYSIFKTNFAKKKIQHTCSWKTCENVLSQLQHTNFYFHKDWCSSILELGIKFLEIKVNDLEADKFWGFTQCVHFKYWLDIKNWLLLTLAFKLWANPWYSQLIKMQIYTDLIFFHQKDGTENLKSNYLCQF